jgi:cbb3-type cytochrome oxidase subunit 3
VETGQIIIPSTADMVTGFGHAFLTAALITGSGIVIAFSFKHQKQQQQNNEDKLKMS